MVVMVVEVMVVVMTIMVVILILFSHHFQFNKFPWTIIKCEKLKIVFLLIVCFYKSHFLKINTFFSSWTCKLNC